LRLVAPADAIARAEEVMQQIVETYRLPHRDFGNPEDGRRNDVDILRAFSETCGEELRA
jgi:hypothetical protein